MRKAIFAMMIFLLCLTSRAQQEAGTWAVQVRLGMNVAGFTSYKFKNQTYSHNASADPRIGMHFGLEVERQLTDVFGLAAGAQYSMQGDKEKAKVMGYNFGMTNKVDYINIPLLAKFYVSRRLALKAGLQPAFCVRKVYDDGIKLSKIGVHVRDFDLAIPVGIAYEFANPSRIGLTVEARWNMGLLKMAEGTDPDGDTPHNSVFQLSLGYRFSL